MLLILLVFVHIVFATYSYPVVSLVALFGFSLFCCTSFPCFLVASYARLSAISFPWFPACAFIHVNFTVHSRLSNSIALFLIPSIRFLWFLWFFNVYVCMYVRMYVFYLFIYIIKYAPSPGSDTTYYNVSSYTYLFMGSGCRVCLCSGRRTLHSLYNVYPSIGIS